MKRIRIHDVVYTQEGDYLVIEKWLLEAGDTLAFDLYIEEGPSPRKSLFWPREMPLETDTKKMIEQKRFLYIRAEDLPLYDRFVEGIVQVVARNGQIPIAKKAAVIYRQASVILDEMFENPEELENIPKSKKVVNGFIDTIFSDVHAIASLIKITSYDYYTHTHSINVCIYALCLGSYLELSPLTLRELGISALLHDLGKSRIDSNITNKKGSLTDAEFEMMKFHPLFGHAIATRIGIKDRRILDGIRHHHEKLDGSGYPDGVRGEEITLFARIIGVCDVFDALSTQRPYKERLSSYESLLLMKQTMRRHLDMEVVDAFIRMQRHDDLLTAL